MFWEWYWELYNITFENIQPCPSCHLWPSNDCGYCERTYFGDFDCFAPDSDELYGCEDCHHLICTHCKKEANNESTRPLTSH